MDKVVLYKPVAVLSDSLFLDLNTIAAHLIKLVWPGNTEAAVRLMFFPELNYPLPNVNIHLSITVTAKVPQLRIVQHCLGSMSLKL